MSGLSYIVETNGENGVRVEYRILDYTPQNVVWDENNTFADASGFPEADAFNSPEYVRAGVNGNYSYYRRMITLPAKSVSFSLYVLSDGVRIPFTCDIFGTFLSALQQGGSFLVTSKTNTSGFDRDSTVSVTDSIYGVTLQIPVRQEYTPIRMALLSYAYENIEGSNEGDINSDEFEHTFHWLTDKTSPNKETLEIEVAVSGPRNGYVVRDISEYAYAGEIDENYVVSLNGGGVYETTQVCYGNGLLTSSEPVVFDQITQSIFKKVKYDNDLKVVRDGRFVRITNYGRCFLQEDAYYVITLSNVDDLDDTAKIVVRYESDDMAIRSRGDTLVNPIMWLEEGCVMLHTDNDSNANEHFRYYVSFANGQLVYSTDMPETISSRIENNELITEV